MERDVFEEAMLKELEDVAALVVARRDALVQTFTSGHESMGRMFALGAVDSALWRLILRAKGDTLSG